MWYILVTFFNLTKHFAGELLQYGPSKQLGKNMLYCMLIKFNSVAHGSFRNNLKIAILEQVLQNNFMSASCEIAPKPKKTFDDMFTLLKVIAWACID